MHCISSYSAIKRQPIEVPLLSEMRVKPLDLILINVKIPCTSVWPAIINCLITPHISVLTAVWDCAGSHGSHRNTVHKRIACH